MFKTDRDRNSKNSYFRYFPKNHFLIFKLFITYHPGVGILKFSRYPVPSGTQILKFSMVTGVPLAPTPGIIGLYIVRLGNFRRNSGEHFAHLNLLTALKSKCLLLINVLIWDCLKLVKLNYFEFEPMRRLSRLSDRILNWVTFICSESYSRC